MAYEIKLDIFEGPIDLLLYLIRKNEIDIYNIPIVLITDQYLKCLEIIRSLNLDLAGEYLVMASTLIHIKSRMLLPFEDDGVTEEEQDPRANLVRQLLDYQAYKDAAANLDSRFLLERDVFKRGHSFQNIDETGDEDTAVELSLFDLFEAFRKIILQTDKTEMLEIDGERMSLTDRINEIMDKLLRVRNLTFTDLLEEHRDQRMIIYTFLAILELMKLRIIKVYQSGTCGAIRIFPVVEEVVGNL
jgi:segregation and condensation protein A